MKRKESKEKLQAIKTASEKERKERITSGTWMGRSSVMKSKKNYDRNREKQMVRGEE